MAALRPCIASWQPILEFHPVPPLKLVVLKVPEPDGIQSLPLPAQQTVSPYFRLGFGIALTRTTTREFLGVIDIAARLIAKKIENFKPAHF
jgi:hypothetical protein